MKKIVAFLAGMLLLVPLSSARAYKIGEIDLKIDAGVSETYDDNVTYVKDNKKDDFITAFKLGVTGAHEGKSHTARVRLGFEHDLYARNSDFSNTRQMLDADGAFELSKYERATLSESYLRAEDPASFEDEFGRASGRYSYILNRFDADYSRDISKQLTFNAGYTNELYFPSRSTSSDSYGNALRFSADYAVRSTTVVSGIYTVSHRAFNPGKSALSNLFAAGARHYLTSQVYLDGTAGMDVIRAYDGDWYARPAFTLTATDELDENTRAHVSFTRRYDLNAYTADTFDNWRVSAGADRQLLSRLGGSVNAFFGQGEYDRSAVKETTSGIGAGLRYDLTEDFALNAGYTFACVSSNDDTRDYARNRFIAGISAAF